MIASATRKLHTLLLIVGFFIAAVFPLVSRPLARWVSVRWLDLSPWWSVAVVGPIFLYAVALVNYRAFLRVEGRVEAKWKEKLDALSKDNESLRAEIQNLQEKLPKPDPHQQYQIQIVRAGLHEFTPDEQKILRFIVAHGRVNRSTVVNKLTGYEQKLILSTVAKAGKTGVLKIESDQITGDQWWWVNPTLEAALASVLSESGT